ncbi:hypothetical protein Poli38472_011009 [Pythium oligandrum]|uniref:Uncharacterized protein n=1 Tax=Pythium oligandrum TaxID=41045 RepID=A0A8K1CPT4_PYTOL|nr:hypothetical protein Poli38472_011009 [Pythium oligandrum]|eukprot:TMW67389.1 hypothetical protein Poli38472_011009 [Pythium oligandrum]
MKPGSRSQNLEEGEGLIRRAPVAHESKIKSKRALAVGASIALLAAGAACAYVAIPSGSDVVTVVPTEKLEADTFVMPTEDTDDDDSLRVDIPPFSDYDRNGDSVISNDEYLFRMGELRDNALRLVETSMLPLEKKNLYTTRLKKNYLTESACVTRLVNRDRKSNGAVTEDRFDVFYTMIKEFCELEDVVIPPEFRATETPSPSINNQVETETPQLVEPTPGPTNPVTYTPETPVPTNPVTFTPETPVPTNPVTFTPETPVPTNPVTYTPETPVPTNPVTFTPETPVPTNPVTYTPTNPVTVPATVAPTTAPSNSREVVIPEGQAIKCSSSDTAVYRYTSGERRWYPSPDIASSWDLNWGKFIIVDCSSIKCGDDMPYKRPAIPEGQAVKCKSTDAAVFRYCDGKIRWYPSPRIAASWDPAWDITLLVDCSSIPRGPDMSLKLPPPIGLPEGQAIKCNPDEAAVYRLTNGQRRWYPDPPIATSWDANWGKFLVVDCSSLPRGDDMPYNTVSPSKVPDGQAVKCDYRRPDVYRFTGGGVRWYPNPEIATSWDPNWGKFFFMDCTSVPRGKDMPFNQPAIPEGQAVKCSSSDAAIFRFCEGQIRWYPSPPVAASWDPVWDQPIVVNCRYLPRGPDMPYKLRSPVGLPEGQAIKCNPDEAAVYRLVSGHRRWYPNPPIADSWDPSWGKFLVVDCSSLPRGDDMPLKLDGWKLLDGMLVQISFDGRFLCGVNRDDDIWCASENIRGEGSTRWRQIPGKLMHIQVYGDFLWGVNRANEIYVGSVIGDPQWRRLPGSLKQITSDNKQVCGVNANDDIFCANTNIRTDPNWRQLPGKLSYVSLLNGRLVGTNSNGAIFTGRAAGDPKWTQLDGILRNAMFDGARICGTNSADDVWCADNGLQSNPNWSMVRGKMRQVATSAGQLYSIDPSGYIFYRVL